MNPWHLEPVTNQENDRRYRQKVLAQFPQAPLDTLVLMERADDLRLEAYRRRDRRAVIGGEYLAASE